VPVEFLSDDQAAAYERFVGDLTRSELEGFFMLDGTALDLIANKRGAHNGLGFGLQIGTVRYLGHFLTEDPIDVPWSAVEYVASQLDIADPSVVKRYTVRQPTAYEHSWEIRAAYGYRDFADPGVHEPLVEFMSARAWIHAEGAVALFEQAKAWLRRERVLLPGVTVLARLVASVREDADRNQCIYRAGTVVRRPHGQQCRWARRLGCQTSRSSPAVSVLAEPDRRKALSCKGLRR
jgi:hypothetical protein